jgi:hypothetical protein
MLIGETFEKKARTNEYAIAWGTRIDAHTGLRGGGIRTMPDPAYPATMGKSPTASLIPLPLCVLTPADPFPPTHAVSLVHIWRIFCRPLPGLAKALPA